MSDTNPCACCGGVTGANTDAGECPTCARYVAALRTQVAAQAGALAAARHALRELCRWGTKGQGAEGDCWCEGPPSRADHSPGCRAARAALLMQDGATPPSADAASGDTLIAAARRLIRSGRLFRPGDVERIVAAASGAHGVATAPIGADTGREVAG